MIDIDALVAANEGRWARAVVVRDLTPVARRLVAAAAKRRYQAVAARTGVPWWFIAVVHQRECSQSWAGSLAQGDRWDRVSVHIPAGRGPFGSWEDAAIDALVNCAPLVARNRDWSAGGALTRLEQYNGLGYARRGVPSPYLWAGTDQYESGKFVRDGVFDPTAIDRQPGCAALLRAMASLDPEVLVGGASAAGTRLRAHQSRSMSQSPSRLERLLGRVGATLALLLKRTSP